MLAIASLAKRTLDRHCLSPLATRGGAGTWGVELSEHGSTRPIHLFRGSLSKYPNGTLTPVD